MFVCLGFVVPLHDYVCNASSVCLFACVLSCLFMYAMCTVDVSLVIVCLFL